MASIAETKIRRFEDDLLRPALDEVARTRRVVEEFEPQVVLARPATDSDTDELLAALDGAAGQRRRAGPALVLVDRDVAPCLPPVAGRYAVKVFYSIEGDEVLAAPVVAYWMLFDGKLHAFNHRYDTNVAAHPIEQVTRAQILNHVLGSFEFFRIHALSPELPLGWPSRDGAAADSGKPDASGSRTQESGSRDMVLVPGGRILLGLTESEAGAP